MTATLTSPPPKLTATSAPPWYRLSVAQFHAMIDASVFGGDRVELLEGILVDHTDMNSPHAISQGLVDDEIRARLPAGWHTRAGAPITLATSQPIPDVVVAPGARRDFHPNHPTPADVAVVVEVSDATRSTDRGWKRRIYAAARVAVYWVVNLVDGQVEVHTDPHGSGDAADYANVTAYRPPDAVPLSIGGVALPPIPVAALLP